MQLILYKDTKENRHMQLASQLRLIEGAVNRHSTIASIPWVEDTEQAVKQMDAIVEWWQRVRDKDWQEVGDRLVLSEHPVSASEGG